MKVAWVLAAISFATLSSAQHCQPGWRYCGDVLYPMGHSAIEQAIKQAGKPLIDQGHSTLFSCFDSNAVIKSSEQCSVGQCILRRSQDDYCASSPNLTVNLRIVDAGKNNTLFEGTVSNVTYGDVKPQTGGAHKCDGTNGNESPFPGPTCTNALHRGTEGQWDGLYYTNMEDFFVGKILGVPEVTNTTFWSLWLNFKSATVGGCQAQIKNHDSVLWALIPYGSSGDPSPIPLKLKGPRTAKKNKEIAVTVINGADGTPVKGANVTATGSGSVATGITGQYGAANLMLTKIGIYTARASKGTDIPSNALEINVTD